MKKEPWSRTFPIAAFLVLLSSCGNLACSSGDPADFTEVRQLLLLEGNAYSAFRDDLLNERTDGWDQQLADAEEGDLGLAVFILNARTSAPDAFEMFDTLRVIRAQDGDQMLEWSEDSEGPAWQAFVVEHVWKDLWPDGVGQEIMEGGFLR